MASKEPQAQLALDKEQLICLSSPLRYEIVTSLWAVGQASAQQLSQLTGRSITSLYYHLELLLKAKLIRQVASRKMTRNEEAVYEVVARRFLREEIPGDPEHNEALLKSMLSSIHRIEELYEKAFRSKAPAEAMKPFMALETLNIRLTEDRAERLKADIHAVLLAALEREREEGTHGQETSLVLAMAPISRKPVQ